MDAAVVELPALGRVAVADREGRYAFAGLPAGSHEITAQFPGFARAAQKVALAENQDVACNFDLTGRQNPGPVSAEQMREAAATEASSSWHAPIPTSMALLASRETALDRTVADIVAELPGVARIVNDQDLATNFTYRGTGSGSNLITLDGALLGSRGASSRQLRMDVLPATLFERVELVRSSRPDLGTDSLSGTVNVVTRSPFAGGDQATFHAGVRLAPPGTQQTPRRKENPAHPLLSASFQRVLDVFGGRRNLGVRADVYYGEMVHSYFGTTRDFQYAPAPGAPAYLWNYGTRDDYSLQRLMAIAVRADYRLGSATTLSFSTLLNHSEEPERVQYSIRAATGSASTIPNATSGIVPGFTSRITQVRPTGSSAITSNSSGFSVDVVQRHFRLQLRHQTRRFDATAAVVVSDSSADLDAGSGSITHTLSGVGWVLDRTRSDLYPTFTQAGGPSITDPANYRTPTILASDTLTFHRPREARADVRHQAFASRPVFLKAGARWRVEDVSERGLQHFWSYLGTSPLPADPTIRTFMAEKTGLAIPLWNPSAFIRDGVLTNPALWREDLYSTESNRLLAERNASETVTSVYGLIEGRLARTEFLGGIRQERTEVKTRGWVRSHVLSTFAQRASDPVSAARLDYGRRRVQNGAYTHSLPSLHVAQLLAPNFKFRAGWSQSTVRPPFSLLFPSEQANDFSGTVAATNPNLAPATAKTWDIALDWSFGAGGRLSVAWFEKHLWDLGIYSGYVGEIGGGPNNGFNGDYEGYLLISTFSGGSAVMRGWEIDYRYPLDFLPAALGRFSLAADVALNDIHLGYGDPSARSAPSGVSSFIGRSGNARIDWNRGRLGAHVGAHYVGEFSRAASPLAPGAALYTRPRTVYSVGMACQLTRALRVTANIENAFTEPQEWYRGTPDQMAQAYHSGVAVVIGLRGRF